MLQENASDNPFLPALPMRAPKVAESTKALEAELTLRTKSILRAVMKQVVVTKQETEIDSLIRQVNIRFAYDQIGLNQLPMSFRPGFNYPHHLWWPTLKHQLCGLVYHYYHAIEHHQFKDYLIAAERLEEMIEGRILNYKLAFAEPCGYVLMTTEEWKAITDEKEQRKLEILENQDRIAESRLDDDGG